MTARQIPRQWLVADTRSGSRLWQALRTLPRGSGVLLLHHGLSQGERARLLAKIRRIARIRGFVIADEAAGVSARVHNLQEVRAATARRVPLLFLSPLFPTRSHPHWKPLPRLRSAAIVRLAPVPVIALGGMDERRFGRLERLGFAGWAGINSWLERRRSRKPRL